MVLKLHHLNNSRSQKSAWLLEELGVDYEMVPHQRLPTLLGPPALKAAHPLGKAPVLEIDGTAIVESGAIADYLLRRYDDGTLMPPADSPQFPRFLEWMNFAVATGSTPVMYLAWGRSFGLEGTDFWNAATAEMDLVLGYVESALADGPYLLGDAFSAADIQVSFVAELGRAFHAIDRFPHVRAWLKRLSQRPAYQRAAAPPVGYAFGG